MVQAKGALLEVATAATHLTDALRGKLGHGRLAAHLKLPLHVKRDAAATGRAALVFLIAADTHSESG